MPFILVVTHPVWLVTSLIIAFRFGGSGFDIARVWNTVVRVARAVVRRFKPCGSLIRILFQPI